MPPQEWHSQVLCTCTDNMWEEYSTTMLQGVADFTKDPATICIINTTSQDLVLKSLQIVAEISPIELQKNNTTLFFETKMGESCDVNQLHSLFEEMFDSSKRKDNKLPSSLFNIIHVNH